MTGSGRLRPAFLVGLIISLLVVFVQDVHGEEQADQVPSEVQCRPYIEKALKHRDTEGTPESSSDEVETNASEEVTEQLNPADESQEDGSEEAKAQESQKTDDADEEVNVESLEASHQEESAEDVNKSSAEAQVPEQESGAEGSVEAAGEGTEEIVETEEKDESPEVRSQETEEVEVKESEGDSNELNKEPADDTESEEKKPASSVENEQGDEPPKSVEEATEENNETVSDESGDAQSRNENDDETSVEQAQSDAKSNENDTTESEETKASVEDNKSEEKDNTQEQSEENKEGDVKDETESSEKAEQSHESSDRESLSKEEDTSAVSQNDEPSKETDDEPAEQSAEKSAETVPDSQENDEKSEETGESTESRPEEEELIQEIEVPENIRARDHIGQLLRLDQENEEKEAAISKAADIVLKDLKKLYDNSIKPLETLYKYRDLSNRHFGDSEIFSKPLILFMGPWSGGKSSIINYLLDIEYKPTALRTGAEPSPAYFNILMYGEEEEILDGTQLAADWTFSGLQKFGQGMLDRLRGLRLKNKLLEKVNIVEIPGILEIRKQVQRLFPFNDACQWFIDRADIIFLVYDPAKLDVGPETEAILDQLKGREYQTRIVLNKADQVKPEELMRVQGALIWNISPLMSSAEPPVMYSTSLWSLPYEASAPTRLLYAQERAFLRDLRTAVDKRVEHKIASARRFAVRVRNHAKMVDCYLTTYYNHKSFFGSKKEISDKIIENPQNYHIYEGLSTLTNISRYDLPDPDVYRDFFRLNALYDFPLLSSTCTYFRGCPINRLDVAIAYDLPELVGKYRKSVEALMHEEISGKSPAS